MSDDGHMQQPAGQGTSGPRCPDCGTAPPPGASFCAQCGARLLRLPGRMAEERQAPAPACPRCGRPVRGGGPFPRREPGTISALPWNAGWDGRCTACGLLFELQTEYDSRRTEHFPSGTHRRVVFHPGSATYWTYLDLQDHQPGIDIEVTTRTGSDDPHTERLFLTMNEVRQLMNALQGPLALLFDQEVWAYDTT